MNKIWSYALMAVLTVGLSLAEEIFVATEYEVAPVD